MSANEITGRVVGGVEVEAKFLRSRATTAQKIEREIRYLSAKLQRKVKEEKLSGQVLRAKTGRGRRSINQKIRQLGSSIWGAVGTIVDYMAAWELGFLRPAIDIYPKKKRALFWPGADHPVTHVHQPARQQKAKPYLVPSLLEMRPEIQLRLARAAFLGIEGA